MVGVTKMGKSKTSVKENTGTSVKSYQGEIDTEKQKMNSYAKKMSSNVRALQNDAKSLQNDFKKHAKDMNAAALALREDGIQNMNTKVTKFKGEIRAQIRENKEAIAHMGNSVNYFVSQINGKKRDFRTYAKGEFQNWIKSFWG